jgi:hypothetical protein
LDECPSNTVPKVADNINPTECLVCNENCKSCSSPLSTDCLDCNSTDLFKLYSNEYYENYKVNKTTEKPKTFSCVKKC